MAIIDDLDGFNIAKQNLLAAYDLMRDSRLVPIDTITKQSLEEKRNKLLSERFSLAVCGQMNSGKSTLLNALVFGKKVLPADDTVMTASVTAMKFAEEEGFEVVFYNKDEWRALREGYAKDEQALAGFHDLVDRSERAGAPIAEYIGRPPQRFKGYDALLRYVGTPEQGGACSVYVKEVTLFHTNEAFADVDVVDTPGVNDPNEMRSSITKQWIHNASAVIFVTFAGQTMSQPDYDFIDRFLLGIPTDRRVLAVNKIDTIENVADIEVWLDRLRRGDDARTRSIVGPREMTALVSAYGALLSAIHARGIELSEDELEMAQILQRDPSRDFLEPEFHGMGELRKLVEGRLIANKGAGIISEHTEFLRSIVEKNRRTLHASTALALEVLDINDSSRDELIARRKELDAQAVRIESIRVDIERSVNERRYRLELHIDQDILALRDGIEKEVSVHLERLSKTSSFQNETVHIVQRAAERHLATLMMQITDYQKQHSDEVQSWIERCQTEFQDQLSLSTAMVTSYLDMHIADAAGPLRDAFRAAFSYDFVSDLVTEATYFWQRWFDTAAGLQKIRSAIIGDLNAVLDMQINALAQRFKGALREYSSRITNGVAGALTEATEKVRENISEAVKDEANVEARILEARQRLESDKQFEREIEELESKMNLSELSI